VLERAGGHADLARGGRPARAAGALVGRRARAHCGVLRRRAPAGGDVAGARIRLAMPSRWRSADDLLPWGDLRNDAKRPAAIERVISLCQANPVQPLDVPRMARAAGYSRHHFSRVFRGT